MDTPVKGSSVQTAEQWLPSERDLLWAFRKLYRPGSEAGRGVSLSPCLLLPLWASEWRAEKQLFREEKRGHITSKWQIWFDHISLPFLIVNTIRCWPASLTLKICPADQQSRPVVFSACFGTVISNSNQMHSTHDACRELFFQHNDNSPCAQ